MLNPLGSVLGRGNGTDCGTNGGSVYAVRVHDIPLNSGTLCVRTCVCVCRRHDLGRSVSVCSHLDLESCVCAVVTVDSIPACEPVITLIFGTACVRIII